MENLIVKIDRILDGTDKLTRHSPHKKAIDKIVYNSKYLSTVIIENDFKRVYEGAVKIDNSEQKGIVLAFAHLTITRLELDADTGVTVTQKLKNGDIYNRYSDWMKLNCSIHIHSVYVDNSPLSSFESITLNQFPLATNYQCHIDMSDEKNVFTYTDLPITSTTSKKSVVTDSTNNPVVSLPINVPPTNTSNEQQILAIIQDLTQSIRNLTGPEWKKK